MNAEFGWESLTFPSPTGAAIVYRHIPAEEPAKGILLISHGLAEHSKRYRPFATAMAKHGFHVYAWDHRGHGETTAPDATLGRFARKDGVATVIADTIAMRDLAASAHPGLPVILFGHSMGGLVALNTVIDKPQAFDGVAVWNSNFNPGFAGRIAKGLLFAERALKGSDVPSDLLPRLTFGAWGQAIKDRRTAFDWLSSVPGEVDAYITDPLCGFDAHVALWLDLFDMAYRAPRLIDRLPKNLPIHLLGGGEDPATNNGREILWLSAHFRRQGFDRVTTRIWPAARHETLNDTVRDAATAEFAEWASTVARRT